MARPLRYDDQFTSIIKSQIHEKFLFCFNIKVPSTAFCQKINLQTSLKVIGLIDFLIGLGVFIYFFRILDLHDGVMFLAENLLLLMGMFFGILGVDSANNLKKRNAGVYYLWRICITFLIPIIEFSVAMTGFCFYWSQCSVIYFSCTGIAYLLVNIYFTKISWAFYTRLDKGHELLVIHGKYLEQMYREESYKIKDSSKYIPPHLKNHSLEQREKELIHFGSQGTVMEENMFAPKKNNPFKSISKTVQYK